MPKGHSNISHCPKDSRGYAQVESRDAAHNYFIGKWMEYACAKKGQPSYDVHSSHDEECDGAYARTKGSRWMAPKSLLRMETMS